MDPLRRVTRATTKREVAHLEWVASLREATKTHTLAEVADAAGISRARVSQIVGKTGRAPGRRKQL